jgi:ketosteroid isomerase-like protein
MEVLEMNLSTERGLVERYYRGMEAGSAEAMDGLFADDAVYVEPFSKGGEPTMHSGRKEIVGWLSASFEAENRGVTITLDRLDLDGESIVAEWTCVGPMLPGPMKGHDRYTVRHDRIARLETRLGPA